LLCFNPHVKETITILASMVVDNITIEETAGRLGY